MITKKQASEVVEAQEAPGRNQSYAMAWYDGMLESVEALDRAGAFPSEATLAEIADVANRVLAAEAAEHKNAPWFDSALWRNAALRLASACRAAGLVKP